MSRFIEKIKITLIEQTCNAITFRYICDSFKTQKKLRALEPQNVIIFLTVILFCLIYPLFCLMVSEEIYCFLHYVHWVVYALFQLIIKPFCFNCTTLLNATLTTTKETKKHILNKMTNNTFFFSWRHTVTFIIYLGESIKLFSKFVDFCIK